MKISVYGKNEIFLKIRIFRENSYFRIKIVKSERIRIIRIGWQLCRSMLQLARRSLESRFFLTECDEWEVELNFSRIERVLKEIRYELTTSHWECKEMIARFIMNYQKLVSFSEKYFLQKCAQYAPDEIRRKYPM